MVKPNDSKLDYQSYLAVQKEAEKILHEADAVGVFPTPIDQILHAAKVTELPDQVLDQSLVSEIRNRFSDSLKSALKKVQGLFDAVSRLIFVDKSLYIKKQNFIRLHEAGHAYMPHQSQMYKAVEECEYTLSSEVADQFDIEANVFASEVLFQNDAFIDEALQSNFSIRVPINLSKKFEASIYASIRQYVSKHRHCCTVLVLNRPVVCTVRGFRATLRRTEASEKFRNEFSNQEWPSYFSPDDEIGQLIPLNGRRMSDKKQLSLTDNNDDLHEFTGEAFTNTYQVFILLHQNNALTSTRIIIP